MAEGGGHDGLVEGSEYIGEEGALLLRLDGVDGGEGEADEAVGCGVLGE